jgi:glycosyltransferase involved in cell wall biosynthesis
VIDVAIFFGRPDRNQALAERLPRRGIKITVYGDQHAPGTCVPVGSSLPAALARLLTTRHDAYLTAHTFFPVVALYLNHLVRRRPYVFNAISLLSAMYHERSLRWPFPRLVEHRVYPLLERRVLRGAAAIVCNSRYLATRLVAMYPEIRPKLRIVYNGIDFERFASGRQVRIGGVPDSAATLLTVGTWEYPEKTRAGRLLIDAMEHISARRPDARLVFAVQARHRRWARLNDAYLASRPWRNTTRILYNRTDIPDLLATADIFLYATSDTSNDSLPRALLEAHAAGLPIVTTNSAGCGEVVEHGVTGFVVDPDPAALAAGVLTLLEDSAMRRRFGLDGRQRVREIFSWDRMADGYAEVLRDRKEQS